MRRLWWRLRGERLLYVATDPCCPPGTYLVSYGATVTRWTEHHRLSNGNRAVWEVWGRDVPSHPRDLR